MPDTFEAAVRSSPVLQRIKDLLMVERVVEAWAPGFSFADLAAVGETDDGGLLIVFIGERTQAYLLYPDEPARPLVRPRRVVSSRSRRGS